MTPTSAPVARPADVLLFGASAWNSPSLTEHHLARALARKHRVLYVESVSSVATPLRGGVDRVALAAAARHAREGMRHEDGVAVLRALTLPPVSSPRAQRLSVRWLRRQVRIGLRTLGMRPDLVVTTRIVEGGREADWPVFVSVVKDWMQAGAHITGHDVAGLRAGELWTWRQADVVCAISESLRERLGEDGIEAHLLRHGFDATRAPLYEHAQVPAALASLPRPILGCTGRLDARWAYADLRVLADARPQASLVLVGPVSPHVPREALAELLARPNVHHFPAVSGDDLPSWLSGFDCSLVPYVADEWQRHASPIKIWDYLYLGRPIAATGAPALADLPAGLVDFELPSSALPVVVERALAHGSDEERAARRAYALANTWDDRVSELMALARPFLDGRANRGDDTAVRGRAG